MLKSETVQPANSKLSATLIETIDRKNSASEKWDDLQAIFGNESVLPLWIADMDFTVPHPVQVALQQRAGHAVFGYAHKGPSFYSSIASWQTRRHGWNVHPEWITTTPGVVPAEAISVLAFTNPGDEIIIQPPVYPPFFSVVKKNNRTLIENPLQLENSQYRIDFEDLEQKITPKTRMLIFCSPHNPSGRCWRRNELQRLADMAERYNFLIVSDEIFGDLVLNGKAHIPIASLNDNIAARTVTCAAPSKTFNIAGLSAAYTIIPDPELRRLYRLTISGLGLTEINNFGVAALTAAYDSGEPWLAALLDYLRENLATLENFVANRLPQIKLIKPQATFLAWLDCRNISTESVALRDFFINKAGLGLSEGSAFGTQGQGFMRINFACSRELLLQALERIESAL